MINVVADKDIPYLDKVFSNSKNYQLNKLSFDEITNFALKEADALLSRSATPLNGDLLKGTKVKFIGSLTSGEDHINFIEISSLDIEVVTAKGCNAQAVTEYVMDALSVSKEKRIGLIGEGFIGHKLKNILDACGYETKSYDPYVKNDDKNILEEVLNFPIISVHSSYSKNGKYPSHNLVSYLKDNQILINTSRGEIVDYQSIHCSSDATLICDVWNNEPNLSLEDIPNTYRSTPHIAGNTFEAKIKALNEISKKLCNFFEVQDLIMVEPEMEILELDIKMLDETFEKNLIPTDVINLFSPCNKTSSLFKKNMKDIKKEENFPKIFQKIRKNLERKGFGEYSLLIKGIKPSQAELITLLGFKIHKQ